jgi:ABC-type bacteriocin/lantibiotic exporter with double-glycine peptidase domain
MANICLLLSAPIQLIGFPYMIADQSPTPHQTFNQAKAAGNEVFKVIKRKPSISYGKHGAVLEKIHGEIKLRRVHFAYPSRQDKPILQGFSLSIPAGKVVALVGSSGCGKSTVISLLQRFYDPTSGRLLPPALCNNMHELCQKKF